MVQGTQNPVQEEKQADYGDKTIYTKMGNSSTCIMAKAPSRMGPQIVMYSTGRLSISPSGYGDYANKATKRLKTFGIESEVLDKKEINYRWPQIGVLEQEVALYNSGGVGGSTLLAREACRVTPEKFIENGGKFIHAKALPGKTATTVNCRQINTYLPLGPGSGLSSQRY